MNVVLVVTVMSMLSVTTSLEVSLVPVTLDTSEMAHHAVVRVLSFNRLSAAKIMFVRK